MLTAGAAFVTAYMYVARWGLRYESPRNRATRRYSNSIGKVDGSIIATIIATHMTMNARNCPGEPEAISIHIMLMLHPPGMGIVIDIV